MEENSKLLEVSLLNLLAGGAGGLYSWPTSQCWGPFYGGVSFIPLPLHRWFPPHVIPGS